MENENYQIVKVIDWEHAELLVHNEVPFIFRFKGHFNLSKTKLPTIDAIVKKIGFTQKDEGIIIDSTLLSIEEVPYNPQKNQTYLYEYEGKARDNRTSKYSWCLTPGYLLLKKKTVYTGK